MKNNLILGAVAGDIIGSAYEFHNVKRTDFELFPEAAFFTDDSVLTFACMDVLLGGGDYESKFREYGRGFPHRGYGGTFAKWIHIKDMGPYNSWGNGAGMRASPVGWACRSPEETLAEAARSAEVTHNHPEGIKGAQAIAASVFLARTGKSKEEIKAYVKENFGYNLDRKIDDIRPGYDFDVSCQGSVPEAIIAFLESSDYESAVRLAVSLGGDSDTIANMAGGIADAFYGGVPEAIAAEAQKRLTPGLVALVEKFTERFRRN
jgi:ADP-ribosylglycohydrolase